MVPPCDYFITDPPFILEFDESQHFSEPRWIALSCYPADLPMGFSVPQWQSLCREINAQDDVPFDRDERRAWYDTLRDLVPLIHGFRPTIRLYGGATVWCAMNAARPTEVSLFRALIAPS